MACCFKLRTTIFKYALLIKTKIVGNYNLLEAQHAEMQKHNHCRQFPCDSRVHSRNILQPPWYQPPKKTSKQNTSAILIMKKLH